MMLTCDHIRRKRTDWVSVMVLSELTPEDTSGREAVRIALDDLKPSKYYAENIANLAAEIRLRRGSLCGTLSFSCTIVPIRTD
jgi:hypothetical protein